MKTIVLWCHCGRENRQKERKRWEGVRDEREKAGSEWWGEERGQRQSETERQHIIWDSQPMCWDLSEPSLPLILLWIIKYPHLSISLPTTPLLPPLHTRFFSPSLFHSASCICSTFGCTRCSALSLSSSSSVSSSQWEWDSCPTMKLWKHEHPPEGLVVREHSEEREAPLFVVSHWIFHLNPWNIQGVGHGPRGYIVIMLLCLSSLSSYCLLLLIKWWCMCVYACQRVCYINRSPWSTFGWLDDWQADVPEEPSYHVWSVSASVPWCEHLLKEPVEVCVCAYVCLYMHMAKRISECECVCVGGCAWAPERET